jgi:threonine dehydratase
LVSDDAILEARQYLWDEFRLFVEPSAALGVAAGAEPKFGTS